MDGCLQITGCQARYGLHFPSNHGYQSEALLVDGLVTLAMCFYNMSWEKLLATEMW